MCIKLKNVGSQVFNSSHIMIASSTFRGPIVSDIGIEFTIYKKINASERNFIHLLGIWLFHLLYFFKSVHNLLPLTGMLFLLGILLAVAVIQTNEALEVIDIRYTFNEFYTINGLLELQSSIIEIVQLMAGTIKMNSLDACTKNHGLLIFLAYYASSGESLLIIGSATGIAAMWLLKYDFCGI